MKRERATDGLPDRNTGLQSPIETVGCCAMAALVSETDRNGLKENESTELTVAASVQLIQSNQLIRVDGYFMTRFDNCLRRCT